MDTETNAKLERLLEASEKLLEGLYESRISPIDMAFMRGFVEFKFAVEAAKEE